MKLLFIADGRSPIALNWIQYFVDGDHEVHLASTYPCAPEMKLASLTVIPAAFGDVAGDVKAKGAGGSSDARFGGKRAILRRLIPVGLRIWVRQFAGPLTLPAAARRLAAVATRIQPDLIHAMRIPFEGMLAVGLPGTFPLVVSVWGNDFTLHARANPWMARLTRQSLSRADALHTDCQRDQKLAREWGFAAGKPAIVLPGNGGIDLDVFNPGGQGVGERGAIIVNPRGIRGYVRNDTFFRAIPLVLQKRPEARFICPAMAGESEALRWVNELGISQSVELLPRLTRPQMAEQFQRAQVVVSLTEHDGTPNTLLEALACGCYPVAGDIESLWEWITPGINGCLAAPDDPAAAAATILGALESPQMRESAAGHNIQLIRQRAEYHACMAQAEAFYRSLR